MRQWEFWRGGVRGVTKRDEEILGHVGRAQHLDCDNGFMGQNFKYYT